MAGRSRYSDGSEASSDSGESEFEEQHHIQTHSRAHDPRYPVSLEESASYSEEDDQDNYALPPPGSYRHMKIALDAQKAGMLGMLERADEVRALVRVYLTVRSPRLY